MGVYIKIPNVTFTKYIGVAEIEGTPVVPDEPTVPDTYPDYGTLKGLYYLGGTVEDSVVNRAGGANATVSGKVTASDGYVTITGDDRDNRIITDINTSISNKTTFVALFRVRSGNRPIVSNRASASAGLSLSNKAAHYNIDGASKNAEFDCGSINSDTAFVLLAMTADAKGVRAVKDDNGMLVKLAEYTGGGIGTWADTAKYCIGGAYARVSYNGTADIALVSIHEGDMTDDQLKQIFAYVRAYGESKGLTIE